MKGLALLFGLTGCAYPYAVAEDTRHIECTIPTTEWGAVAEGLHRIEAQGYTVQTRRLLPAALGMTDHLRQRVLLDPSADVTVIWHELTHVLQRHDGIIDPDLRWAFEVQAERQAHVVADVLGINIQTTARTREWHNETNEPINPCRTEAAP